MCLVKQILLANTTALPATIRIGVNGIAAADLILPDQTVPPNETVTLDLTLPLFALETLEARQGTASAITVTVSGVCEDLLAS